MREPLRISPALRSRSSAAVERTPAALPTALAPGVARLAAPVDLRRCREPLSRAHALVEEARSRCGLVPPVTPDDDQIPQHHGPAQQAHRATAMLIRASVQIVVDMIVSPRVPTV